MKRFHPSSVLCVIVLAFLLVGGASILWGTFFAKDRTASARKEVDWRSQYPFEAAAEPTESSQSVQTDTQSGYLSKINNFQTLLDNGRENLLGYRALMDLCGGFRRLTGQTRTGKAILLNNGYMTNLVAPAEQLTLVKDAASIAALRDSIDAPLLYIQVPQKVCQYDDQMPAGEETYINENFDRYHALLTGDGVPYFDLRDALHKQRLDHYSLYFRTDHHWTLSGGLWAATAIVNELNTRYNLSLDVSRLDPALFETLTYPQWYLGPLGRAVSEGYIAADDFSIVYPSYATSLRVEYPDKELTLSGSFYNTLFDWDILATPCTYDKSAYEALLYGNRPLIRIINEANPDAPRVLIIRDSYCSAVAPYLSLVCGEVDLIDVRRENGNFDGNLTALIQQTEPDLVLVMFCSPCNIDRSGG